MPGKMYGETYRNFRICVDSYDQGVLCGRLYRPGITDQCTRFHSLMQLLVEIESMLDEAKFPQSFTAKRTFAPIQELSLSDGDAEPSQGPCKATFLIRLLFRQHASWQGSVNWVEGNGAETFRSVLELILLMDSALGGCEAPV